jgi:hypothetical protein
MVVSDLGNRHAAPLHRLTIDPSIMAIAVRGNAEVARRPPIHFALVRSQR